MSPILSVAEFRLIFAGVTKELNAGTRPLKRGRREERAQKSPSGLFAGKDAKNWCGHQLRLGRSRAWCADCDEPEIHVILHMGEVLAGTTGLEPATSCVTGMRSNQLNYVPF